MLVHKHVYEPRSVSKKLYAWAMMSSRTADDYILYQRKEGDVHHPTPETSLNFHLSMRRGFFSKGSKSKVK